MHITEFMTSNIGLHNGEMCNTFCTQTKRWPQKVALYIWTIMFILNLCTNSGQLGWVLINSVEIRYGSQPKQLLRPI